MKVIAGLGNPGAEYASTPHSIGFEVVDALARRLDCSWSDSRSFNGQLATGRLGGVKVLLVKPMTFMNSSGQCIAPVLRYHNAHAESDLVVVSDDMDLPLGKMRIRKGGSPGGHNGLKSVIASTGTTDFIRLRLGVGRDGHAYDKVIGYVLGKFSAESRKIADEVVAHAVEALETIETENLENAMNRWNGWSAIDRPPAEKENT